MVTYLQFIIQENEKMLIKAEEDGRDRGTVLSDKTKYEWEILKKDLKPYWTGKRFIGNEIYRMECGEELRKVYEFVKEKNELEIYAELGFGWLFLQPDEQDMEEAVAFIPYFKKHFCHEYDDASPIHERCKGCGVKRGLKDIELFDGRRGDWYSGGPHHYIEPKGYVKLHRYGAATCMDGDLFSMILPGVYQELIKAGFDKKYFRPVFTKSKKVMGYEFVTDHILEKDAYLDKNCRLESICSECGAKVFNYKDYVYDYKFPTITKNAYANLQPVSLTNEFYYTDRVTLLSKEIVSVLRRWIPDDNFIPVFLAQ